MSEAPRIQLERSRPTCPFCKGEVGGGHVWVCPACEAPHHADCHAEHRACATCGPAREAARAEAGPDDPLARLRASVEKAGFVVLRQASDHLFALHPALPAFGEPSLAHALQVVCVGQLTRGQVEADMRRLAREPLARCPATLLYVTDDVDPELQTWLRGADAADTNGPHPRVPLAWTAKGLVAPSGLLGARFPRHDDVARKVAVGATPPPAPPRPAPPAPPPLLAPPRPAPPRPAPAPTMSAAEAKAILLALAAAVGLGVLLLALAMAAAAG